MAPFVTYPDPALRRAAQKRPVDDALRRVGQALLEAAGAVQAYGLAAAHLGMVEPVVVVSVAENATLRDYRLLYNPVIAGLADDTVPGLEGSVSMPGIEIAVKRPVWAEIAFDDAEGRPQLARWEGFVARVAQHEIEQMNGVFFLRHLPAFKRESILRKVRKPLL